MKKILIVDDEKNLLTLYNELLTNENFLVMTACNGVEALSMLNIQKPDLIILDMMMPEMNGLEVCQRIKLNEETENTKIIFVTVMKYGELWDQSVLNLKEIKQKLDAYHPQMIENVKTNMSIINDLNVSGFLSKPFDNNELLALVKKTIAS